ncbi:MAG TPA: hypothetical protein VF548_07830 [Allosphingosinicella sp.]|jgi:glutamine amidotransferase
MCRMIFAQGSFDPRAIFDAAAAMAAGRTADHEGAFTEHPHGWGALWRDPGSPRGLAVLRDVQPAATAVPGCAVPEKTDFLAVHVRRAVLPSTVGPQFTHPLEREADDWLFMHNGSQPTLYRLLGLPCSTFDSAEYFRYLVPEGAHRLDRDETIRRLEAIPEPGSNSGNAIAVNRDRAYLIHWRSPNDDWPRYFTMQQLRTPDFRIVSSEVIPSLAPARHWQPVEPQSVLEFEF